MGYTGGTANLYQPKKEKYRKKFIQNSLHKSLVKIPDFRYMFGITQGGHFPGPDCRDRNRFVNFTLRVNRVNDASSDRVLSFPITWDSQRELATSEPAVAPEDFISDEALIARLQNGDETALGLLVDRYGRILLAIARRILRDGGEAEEIVQEIFLYLYKRSDVFDPSRGSGRTWIKQVAYSRALERRAFLARRQFYAGTDLDSSPDLLKGDTDLEREVSSRLNRTQLRKAFEELPEKQRKVLEMFYFEGLNLREISERIGETLGNVRHHHYRGIEKLRKSAVVQKLRSKQP